MDERLDLVGEMLILTRHGQGHLERQLDGECLVSPVDGAASDGSLEAVGLAHGESPYCNYGGSSCMFSPVRLPESLPEFRSSWCHSSLSYAISLRSRTNSRALGEVGASSPRVSPAEASREPEPVAPRRRSRRRGSTSSRLTPPRDVAPCEGPFGATECRPRRRRRSSRRGRRLRESGPGVSGPSVRRKC